jgi:hypothetical protein
MRPHAMKSHSGGSTSPVMKSKTPGQDSQGLFTRLQCGGDDTPLPPHERSRGD